MCVCERMRVCVCVTLQWESSGFPPRSALGIVQMFPLRREQECGRPAVKMMRPQDTNGLSCRF